MSAPTYLLVGAKGGSGVSTLAVDLARATRRARKNVTLVDADLRGRRAIAELLDGTRQLNTNRGATIHSVARIGDIDVIELVDKFEDVSALRMPELDAVAQRISGGDGLVLVDTPWPFEPHAYPFIRNASRVIVVMEPDMLGSSAARTTLQDLARFGIRIDQVWLAVSDRNRKNEIGRRELERLLGTSIIAEIPRNTEKRSYDRVVDALARVMIEAPEEAPFGQLPGFSRYAGGVATNGHAHTTNGTFVVAGTELPGDAAAAHEARLHNERRDKIRAEINTMMLSRVDLVAASRNHSDAAKIAKLRDTIDHIIDEIVTGRDDIGEFTAQERSEMKQHILDEQLGLGPLEDLMRDPFVSEIMVNGPKQIYVERGGKLSLSDRVFSNDQHLRLVIERIVAPLGRRIDEASPMVDARLPDGSRVNAIIPPLALKGSTLTIRRFGTKRLQIDDLVRIGSLPQPSVTLLKAIVEARLNVVVSGGTGSGKTTFLNILSNFIPAGERIVTIEDAAELKLDQEHVVSLESRPANIEGRGSVTIRDLVKNSLRMRPDRIVVGECRGGEALDMLQAMNTGHDGSLTTLHANTPRDALARMETLVMMAGFDLPIRAIREQIASAVDMVVQIERMRDGSRKVTSITEIVGMEGDIVTLQEIVGYKARGLDESGAVAGDFLYSGVQPHYLGRFEEMGVHFDPRVLGQLKSAGAPC